MPPSPSGVRLNASWVRPLVVVLTAVAAVSACSSAQSGTGSLQSGVKLASPSVTVSPSITPTSGAPASSAATSDQPTPADSSTPALATMTIEGTGTVGASYDMSLWAKDTITDCATHSHGQAIVNYFKAHPCRSATRRLWSFEADGRPIALSIVTVQTEIKKVNNNPDFSAATQLVTLENADGTGSINDLLREGKRIPEAGATIPSNEIFYVGSEDGTVVVMDGWYIIGPTDPKDPRLKSIMLDLALSDASVAE